MELFRLNWFKLLWKKGRPRKGSTNAMILFLSFSNIIGNTLNIVSGLFVAKWLLPEELGVFNGFTIITGYVILVQLGIPSGLSRELPFYLGKKDKDEAYSYASVAQYWQKSLGFFSLLLATLGAVFFFCQANYTYAAGTLVIGITTWQGLYVTKYLKVLFRTNGDFNKLSWIKLINALISFGSIIFIYLYGFYGLCIRASLLAVVDFIVTYRWRPIRVNARWKSSHFKELMRIGLPMYGVANVYGLWPLFQRTLIVTLGGPKALGLFALAVIVENGMNTVSTSMNSVIYPTMATNWGRGAAVSKLIKITLRSFFLSLSIFLVAVPFGWWLLPLFVQHFLPNYLEGVPAAQCMLLVGLLSLTNVFANIYNVIKNQRDRLIVYVSGIITWAITVGVLYFFKGFLLVIFPVGMVMAYLIMMLLNFLHIKRDWHLSAEKI